MITPYSIKEDFDHYMNEARMELECMKEDLGERIYVFWNWNKRVERLLINLGIRKEFDSDRFFDLIGADKDSEDDMMIAGGFWDDMPGKTTIEVAAAYFDQSEHDAWIERAMDPTCWDY